jgi:D-alanine-D-alanine ligase
VVVRRREGVAAASEAARILGSRVVIKPSRQGSALGVTIVRLDRDLESAIARAFELDEYVLVEEFVDGKEVTVGVLERNGIEALPVCEIRTPVDAWYDYAHRYTPGLSEHLIPAPLPEALYRRVQELACEAHEGLQCRDLSRVDFVVPDEGQPIVLEVNTLPGMTATSLYPDEARAAGIAFPELVAHFAERAFQRRT